MGMATIRRNWKLLLATGAFLIGLLNASVGLRPRAAIARADGEDPPLIAMDAATARTVTGLRSELWLTNEVMAAMGCSQAQAEGVFGALRQWVAANGGPLARHAVSEAQARAALASAMRRFNTSKRTDAARSAVSQARASLNSAVAARKQLVKDSLLPAIEARLDEAQKTTFEAARTNVGLPGSLRYAPDVTAGQAAQIRRAGHRRAMRRASAKTSTARATIAESYDTAVREALSFTQRSAVVAAERQIAASLPVVLAAEKRALGSR